LKELQSQIHALAATGLAEHCRNVKELQKNQRQSLDRLISGTGNLFPGLKQNAIETGSQIQFYFGKINEFSESVKSSALAAKAELSRIRNQEDTSNRQLAATDLRQYSVIPAMLKLNDQFRIVDHRSLTAFEELQTSSIESIAGIFPRFVSQILSEAELHHAALAIAHAQIETVSDKVRDSLVGLSKMASELHSTVNTLTSSWVANVKTAVEELMQAATTDLRPINDDLNEVVAQTERQFNVVQKQISKTSRTTARSIMHSLQLLTDCLASEAENRARNAKEFTVRYAHFSSVIHKEQDLQKKRIESVFSSFRKDQMDRFSRIFGPINRDVSHLAKQTNVLDDAEKRIVGIEASLNALNADFAETVVGLNHRYSEILASFQSVNTQSDNVLTEMEERLSLLDDPFSRTRRVRIFEIHAETNKFETDVDRKISNVENTLTVAFRNLAVLNDPEQDRKSVV
jgi:hypothetical protein